MHDNHFVRVNGIDVFYIDEGSGQPMIFIHGSLGTHAVWQPYYDRLKNQFRVIALDLRGHGQTVCATEQAISFEDLIQDLIAFIDALDLADVWLCGWSAGGDLALQVAIELPHRISKLIVGGVTLHPSDGTKQTLMAMGLNADGSLNLEQAQKAIPHLIANWQTVHTQSENHWQHLLNQMGPGMMNPHEVDLEPV